GRGPERLGACPTSVSGLRRRTQQPPTRRGGTDGEDRTQAPRAQEEDRQPRQAPERL
ncbi:MAG: hypothetical protein AVDCRST_MAG72-950, partial [uncultured Nocardioidaceae bacterium]